MMMLLRIQGIMILSNMMGMVMVVLKRLVRMMVDSSFLAWCQPFDFHIEVGLVTQMFQLVHHLLLAFWTDCYAKRIRKSRKDAERD